MSRRVTSEESIERLAERVYSRKTRQITDVESFNQAFDDYMDIEDLPLTTKQDNALRKQVFSSLLDQNPKLRSKILDKDLKEVQRFIRDFEKVERDVKVLQKDKRFDVITTLKGKVVYAEKINVKVKGKTMPRYRDRFGRFVNKPGGKK